MEIWVYFTYMITNHGCPARSQLLGSFSYNYRKGVLFALFGGVLKIKPSPLYIIGRCCIELHPQPCLHVFSSQLFSQTTVESISAFKKPAGLTTGFCRTHSKGPEHSHHETHLLYVERSTKLYLRHILNSYLCRLMMVKVSGQWQHGWIHSSRPSPPLEMPRL